jgi:biopolymer transport protein ExbD
MAMSVGGGGEERPMSDINTTPLVDVMLVLLIIFLIAVPVAIQTVEKLKVPILVSEESQNKVENLMLSVVSTDASGRSPGSLATRVRRVTASAASISTISRRWTTRSCTSRLSIASTRS